MRMPRGATPSLRSDLADSEPYEPEPGVEVFVPSGQIPAPNQELAAAHPYQMSGAAPERFLAWPKEIGFWGNDKEGDSRWAEEAFAKACANPKVFIQADVVLQAARECGSLNFAQFMQTHGFQMDGAAYLDGQFYSVNWMNAALNSAIANSGPVKIGVASATLREKVTPGMSGWAISGLPAGRPEDHCASLCGYGTLAALAGLFELHGVDVQVPPDMPGGLCYAMFTWGSIGIIDQQSLRNITGEAWVRNPTTIVKYLSA